MEEEPEDVTGDRGKEGGAMDEGTNWEMGQLQETAAGRKMGFLSLHAPCGGHPFWAVL